MSFLRGFLHPLIADLLPFLLLLLAALVLLPRVTRKLREMGVWDRLVDRVGGEKYRLLQFEREIARLRKHGEHLAAAQLYEDAEWYPEAIETYIEAEEYNAAAHLCERLEQWDKAAELYLKNNDWKRAAQVFGQSGRHGKAAELFEEHGQKIDAAKCYFETGRFDRAGELYEEVSYFPQAAKAFEKMGDFVRAAENYEKHWAATTSVSGGGLIANPSDREAKIALAAGQLYEKGGAFDKAATIYQRSGLTGQAAALAAKQGHFEHAGEMLLKEEKLEPAAEMFEKAGKTQRAALLRGEVAFHRGDTRKAAEQFLKGGDNLRAAELFESAGDLEWAAKCYEQSDAPLQAANVYLRAGNKERAAPLFEKGRDFEMAARLFSEVEQPAKASALFEQAGRYFEAGKLAHDQGDAERAIRLLQQLDPSHESYESATLILARLFIDKGMASLAVDKLVRAVGDRPIGTQTLEHFYCLGRAYEKLGKTKEAVDTYRKVMAERYGFEDVEQRIAQLTKPHPARPQPVAAPTPATSEAPAAAPPPPPPPLPAAARQPEPTSARPTPGAAPPRPSSRPPAAGSQRPGSAGSAQGSPIELGTELGQGLLGATFKGIDTRNGRPVTIKFLRAELLRDPAIVHQLVAEVRTARSLDHPSVVRMLGLADVQGRKAAVMEFVDGFDLAAFVARRKRLTLKQALDLLTTLCTGLGYAHERKLLHRDLKMSNILVAKTGKLRIGGFGLGALRTPQLGAENGYPAPEFLVGHPPDERVDIYALGGLVFHALTGLHPADEGVSTNGAAPSLRRWVPEAPESLDRILARCLAQEPGVRFASTVEVLSEARDLRG